MTLLAHKQKFVLDKRTAYICLGIVIITVFIIEVDELNRPEHVYGASFEKINDGIILGCNDVLGTMVRSIPAWWMVCFSDEYLGNARLLPFVFSMALLPLTYLVTIQITNKPLVGLLATVGTAIHPWFWLFNDTSTLHQFWVVWFLLSIYFIKRQPLLAIPFYTLSVFTKAIPLLFLPAILYYIYQSKPKRKNFLMLS